MIGETESWEVEITDQLGQGERGAKGIKPTKGSKGRSAADATLHSLLLDPFDDLPL